MIYFIVKINWFLQTLSEKSESVFSKAGNSSSTREKICSQKKKKKNK